MCDCEDDGPEDGEERIALTPTMVTRMRSLESALTGEPVPVEAWDIFLGRESGGIPFAHMLRIQQCRQTVIDEERRARRMFVRARGRRISAPVCVEMSA